MNHLPSVGSPPQRSPSSSSSSKPTVPNNSRHNENVTDRNDDENTNDDNHSNTTSTDCTNENTTITNKDTTGCRDTTTTSTTTTTENDGTQRPLRRGDLVRVSELGQRTSKRLKGRHGHLGRIHQIKTTTTTKKTSTAGSTATPSNEVDDAEQDDGAGTTTTDTNNNTYNNNNNNTTYYYDVDWVMGGQSKQLLREELIWTNAEQEGMTTTSVPTSRTKRKPMDYMSETTQRDHIKQQQKKKSKQQQQQQQLQPPMPFPTAAGVVETLLDRTTTSATPTGTTTPIVRRKTAAITIVRKRKLPMTIHVQQQSTDHDDDDDDDDTTTMIASTTLSSNNRMATTTTTTGKPAKPQASKRGKEARVGDKKSTPATTTTTTTTLTDVVPKLQKSRSISTTATATRKTNRGGKKRNTTASSTAVKNSNNNNTTTKNGDNTDAVEADATTTSTDPTTAVGSNPNTTVTTNGNMTESTTTTTTTVAVTSSLDLYEKHRREFERMFVRCMNKIDIFHHFWNDNQSTMMNNSTTKPPKTTNNGNTAVVSSPSAEVVDNDTTIPSIATSTSAGADDMSLISQIPSTTITTTTLPSVSILNWETIQQYMEEGRYVLDRIQKDELQRRELFGDSFQSQSVSSHTRVINPKGVHWELFRSDVFAMCDTVLELQQQMSISHTKLNQEHCQKSVENDANDTERQESNGDNSDDEVVDNGQKGSVSYTVRKIKEAVQVAVDRTGRRHEAEMKFADDRFKYTRAIESYTNTEPAMQSWRKVPYPERIYERLNSDVVCAGLSTVDEQISAFELKTNLPDSFIGQSYRYDDTGQSEAWMKSVVDETGYKAMSKKAARRRSSNASKSSTSVGGDDPRKTEQERLAALALSADEGVTRAQVSATMQSLLIAVQDRVMTQRNVLRQPELRSANWFATESTTAISCDSNNNSNINNGVYPNHVTSSSNNDIYRQQFGEQTDLLPEIIEQPVWGIDCYTRRNIMCCLNTEFDTDTSLLFIEKWLLPAINACPENLGHCITNAARILEGLPLGGPDIAGTDDLDQSDVVGSSPRTDTVAKWSESLMGRALLCRISVSGPLWLKAAANQLRCACDSLGPDFFRVHPKGHGSVVVSTSLKPNALVTFYRGELYPSWRWGEKMDAIDITQARKDLKPALPDFYNMALERPQSDPRGYGLLFVDASRKAGHGSSLSHSCAPTCEVRVAACEGELCLAMTTLRELEMGEELTFDYNAVTESLNEYRSAVCLCGYGKCRGSFLHFATADCYQQVLNRNSPIASRFSNLIKGSTKQVMSPDDEQILRSHGFVTAAFGAISVNRRANTGSGIGKDLVDSLDMVPVWLRTYVADTLRYIEYERRALPIALICENVSTSSSKNDNTVDLNVDLAVEPAKERKHASSFFYFLKSQSDFLRDLMKKEGFPDNLKGLQFRHAMQKVASNYWSGLPEETKKHYKEQAQLDFEKRMKEGLVVTKKSSAEVQNDTKRKGKDGSSDAKRKLGETRKNKNKAEIHDILHSSKNSFQDADAEGVVAMEQRIQQLTQTLSRVGRVLDRHREGTIDSNPPQAFDAERMMKLVHAPVRVLGDVEVINWIWNSDDGVVNSLCREIKLSRFVRPNLHESLREVWKEYASLASGDHLPNERRQLKEGLLKLRSVIMDELREMTKEFRQIRTHSNIQQSDEASNQNPAISSDYDSEENISESNVPDNERKFSTIIYNSDNLVSSNSDRAMEESHPWIEFYGERFILHAAADALLMYAYTSNFFVVQPYLPLESTPVEVYARELGNEVPRNAIDHSLACNNTKAKLTTSNATIDKSTFSDADKKKKDGEICAPDDIVAKVTIEYDGDYVSSQLLQWYNAGIGQRPGLPDLLGCALLPSIEGCWRSDLVRIHRKSKGDGKTKYETKVRPRLVEWMQDPYERGNPWPQDIRKAFVMDETSEARTGSADLFVAYGSPIIDFLVMGDESNIIDVLYELDADDKITAKTSSSGLLTSVDKGRPAQAVSTWVQCEDPSCMKWRKIPWFVDADLLPERFFCKDNMWNPAGNNCDTPEDDWDKDDAMVGSDGKVEGSPVNKKKFEGSLPVNDESCFRIGTRFDVQRSDKIVYSIATVVKVDFSGSVKRIMFHFAKTSSDRDEWVEFGSTRIAPLNTKVVRKGDNTEMISTLGKETRLLKKKRPKSTDFASRRDDGNESTLKKQKLDNSTPIKRVRPTLQKVIADPSDENCFSVGAKFDVFREDKKRFCWATVVSVDSSGPEMKICFRFPKTKGYHMEWLEFGSPHICEYNSKVVGRERKDQKMEKKKTHVPSDPMNEESYFVGAQFDVYRRDKKRHSRATVSELEFTADGDLKGICFQYRDDRKEWMLFGSRTIFSYKSKLKSRDSKTLSKKEAPDSAVHLKNGDRSLQMEINGPDSDENLPERNILGQQAVNAITTKLTKLCQAHADPTDEKSFVVGTSFDVYREDKRRYSWAIVEDVDYTELVKRICFRFKKSKDNHTEWIHFGSPRICTFKSKTARKESKGKESVENDAPTAITSTTELNGINKSTDNDCYGDDVQSIRYESAIVLTSNEGNNGDMKAPDDRSSMSNGMTINNNNVSHGLYDSNLIPQSGPKHRPPDFITPNDISSFILDNNNNNNNIDHHHVPIQQRIDHITTSTTATTAVSQQPPPSLSTFRNGGSIPKGWSGLDMLAAVTFDAVATTTATDIDPTTSTCAASSSSSAAASNGTEPPSFEWGGGNTNNNNNGSNLNINHKPMWQNQPNFPIWLQQQQLQQLQQQQQQHQQQQQQQQQQQLEDPRQGWHHNSFESRIMSQHAAGLQANSYGHRDMGMNSSIVDNRNFLSLQARQQQHQQQQQQQFAFNGNIGNNSNNNSAANQYYNR